ncbi:MAG TPA: hypothetical protein VNW92_19795 [Polyangiaceae bacterium]|nr:hypothetical protein [Polyangiaceae bacterium]
MVQNTGEVLPAHASLENLRNQAKTLLKQHRAGSPEAAARLAARLEQPIEGPLKLHDAQFVIAREYGFASWPKLVARFTADRPGDRVLRENGRVWIDGVPRLRWGASPEPTYLGALEAAFRSSARPLSLLDLMGDSGLCYRLRWGVKGGGDTWCGSGPCGEWPDEVGVLNRATGYVFKWGEESGPMTPEYLARIKQSIDRGAPILGYPLKMDMGLVYGYEDDGQKLLISDYWASEDGQVIQTADAKGIGLFLDRVEAPASRAEAAKAGLTLALKRWQEGIVEHDRALGSTYFYGPAGYARWVADLERADTLTEQQRSSLFHISSWTYSSLHENRSRYAAEYLRKHAQHFSEKAGSELELAATAYDRCAARFGKWDTSNPTFGMVKQKKIDTWTPEVRAQEIELLRDVWDLDVTAMSAIERALGSG